MQYCSRPSPFGGIEYFIVVFIIKFISNDRCCPVTK